VIRINAINANAYYARGLSYHLAEKHDRAIADYTKAIELNPNFTQAYNNCTWAYFKSGKPADGLPDAEKSLELQPDYPHGLDTRARIFEALGRREEAIADFRRAHSVGANDPDVQTSVKEALKRLGVEP
jgi:tetratricopeptide (TPR) repeat protein